MCIDVGGKYSEHWYRLPYTIQWNIKNDSVAKCQYSKFIKDKLKLNEKPHSFKKMLEVNILKMNIFKSEIVSELFKNKLNLRWIKLQ